MTSTLEAPEVEDLELSEDEILADICRSSFFHFVKEFWKEADQSEPVWNWHIEYLCDMIQREVERIFRNEPKKRDIIVNVPPGTSKSTLFSIMLPAWAQTRMAHFKTICGSYTYSLAMELSRKSRDVSKSKKYQQLFPEIVWRDDQDSKEFYVNTSGGWRYSVGVGGSVMGRHAHLIVIDDPIDPQEALSEASLKTANHWMDEVIPSRKVSKEVSLTIIIMQRLHQDDPTGHRLDKKEASPVRHICIPGELTEDVKPPKLREYYVDGLMDPIRMSRQAVTDMHGDLQDFGYAAQVLQNPIPRGGGFFQTMNFKYVDFAPHDRKFTDIVRYWDKAASSGKGDWTVGIKMGKMVVGDPKDKRFSFFILDVQRGQWDSYSRDKKMLDIAQVDGPHVRIGVEQEPGAGGKESADASVQMFAGFKVITDKVAKSLRTGRFAVKVDKVGVGKDNKVRRADAFSSQVNGGNVYLVKAPWNATLVKEYMYFPFSKWDDQVDAGAGAFNYLSRPPIVVGGARTKKLGLR